jgi:hypothetical protein
MHISRILLLILGVAVLSPVANSQTTAEYERARAREIYSQKAGTGTTVQPTSGDGQPAFKGGTMIAKNASGNYEVCDIVGYQSIIGSPAMTSPFVTCPSDAAAASAQYAKEEAAQQARLRSQRRVSFLRKLLFWKK